MTKQPSENDDGAMTGTFLGVVGSPWHWHAWHAGWGWPFVGLFWLGLWVVVLGLVVTTLWRRWSSFPGSAFRGPGPARGAQMGGSAGGPAGGNAPGERSWHTGTPGEPLRASTEEREATVRALSDAMADGRLSSEEHSERVSAAYAARYRHELAGLTADLPGAKAPQSQGATAATAAPALPGAGLAPVFLPLILVGLILATGAWHFGPAWLLLGLGIWLVVRARRHRRTPTLR